MGMDINSVQFLIGAHRRGAAFKSVLMLGRQSMNVYPAKMVQVLSAAGLPSETYSEPGRDVSYAEPLFEALGATEVASMDASGFEGAQFVHDLNLPIDKSLHERFDVVYDGGTLEHVFNFPVGLRNSMEMVKVGGRLFIHTCANNLCGHGFYQFSPELFFRTFSAENGFQVERVILHVIGPYGRWYQVTDPNEIRSRVELITFTPLQMLIEAKRISSVPVFASAPQQSDYSAMWQASSGTAHADAEKKPDLLKRVLPGVARLLHVVRLGVEFYRRQSLGNRSFFKVVSKTK